MSEVLHRSFKDAKQIAKDKGLVAFYALPDELLIDLDDGKTLSRRVVEVLTQNGVYWRSKLVLRSPGGNGKHVYIKLYRDIDDATRIALQACLGSDRVREVLSLLRCMGESNAPTVLFETKQRAKRVKEWRKDPPRFLEKVSSKITGADPLLDDDIPF